MNHNRMHFFSGEASPTLEGITEERPDPGMLVVPPPPPKKPLPDPESLGAAPEKPDRPPSVDLSQFVPPPLEVNGVAAIVVPR